jgi:hypothetical protein
VWESQRASPGSTDPAKGRNGAVAQRSLLRRQRTSSIASSISPRRECTLWNSWRPTLRWPRRAGREAPGPRCQGLRAPARACACSLLQAPSQCATCCGELRPIKAQRAEPCSQGPTGQEREPARVGVHQQLPNRRTRPPATPCLPPSANHGRHSLSTIPHQGRKGTGKGRRNPAAPESHIPPNPSSCQCGP